MVPGTTAAAAAAAAAGNGPRGGGGLGLGTAVAGPGVSRVLDVMAQFEQQQQLERHQVQRSLILPRVDFISYLSVYTLRFNLLSSSECVYHACCFLLLHEHRKRWLPV